MAQMNKETLELAEALRDLFVEDRVLELCATLDVIPIEAAYSGHDRVDSALTQVAFIPSGSISQPLNEVNQIVWPHPKPIDLLALQEKRKIEPDGDSSSPGCAETSPVPPDGLNTT